MRKLRNAILAAIIMAAIILAGYAMLATIVVETDGVGYQYRDVLGGSDDNGGGDLLDATAYVTSWTAGGASEKIVIQGHFRTTGTFEPSFARYQYKVSLTIDGPYADTVKINGVLGTEWVSTTYDVPDFSNGIWYPMQTAIVTLTNPCYGKIHVELWGHVNDLNPWSSDDGLLAVDEAYIRDGIGTVKVQTDLVEEGDYAEFYVTTGYATSEKSDIPTTDEGWFLIVRNPAGTEVWRTTIANNFASTVKWLVPDGAYKSTWDNTYQVVLRNELLNQDDDWFFVVGLGMMEQVPNKPTFTLISGEEPFDKGDYIKVRLSAKETYNAIKGFTVWVSYETSAGATTEYIYTKKFYAASVMSDGETYFADVSWTFPDAGYCRLEASTLDVLNLNSGIAEMKWTVEYTPPSGDDDDDGGEWDAAGLLFGIAILVVAVIVGLILIWRMPMPWGLLIGLLILAGGIIYGVLKIIGGMPL